MDTIDKVFIALAIAIFTGLACLLTYTVGQSDIRKEALLLGHAHYAYDSKGSPVFKWNECIQMH
jgi:hypothetical protein